MSTPSFETDPAPSGNVLLTDTYLLGRLIRRGGMSEIYEATHARLPGRFAVKILAAELAGDPEIFARFCREAEIMSGLRHPNLVQIFDFNTAPDGRPYLVMEYLEGRDLHTRLADPEPPTLPAVVRVVEAIASALAAAHAHGIVHRDLKPANIFLVAVDGQPDELVKVLDFGISKVRAPTTRPSAPAEVQGSPPYMSPEQVRGATAEIDGRTDQFALGAIAYRMLTGHDAFEAATATALRDQIANGTARPLAHHLPVAWDTRPLQAVLDRALAKDPAERWGGMMEMARAFEAAAERTLSPAIREAPSAEAPPVRFGAAPSGPPGVDVDEEGALLDTGDTLDRIPLRRHRAATLGVVALIAAGVLFATGWYRKIPAAVPRVRQALAAWLPRQPARAVAAEPIAPPAQPVVAPPQPIVATAQPTPSGVATGNAVAAQPDPPAPPATREPTPDPPPDAARAVAEVAPRRHHHVAAPRFRGHPGSVELAAPAPSDPTLAQMPAGFPIEPPATLPDTPARDLAPPAEPKSPPPSTSSDDAPLAPSLP